MKKINTKSDDLVLIPNAKLESIANLTTEDIGQVRYQLSLDGFGK